MLSYIHTVICYIGCYLILGIPRYTLPIGYPGMAVVGSTNMARYGFTMHLPKMGVY